MLRISIHCSYCVEPSAEPAAGLNYPEGMRPKPLLALALPRGVGVESGAELCDFVLAEEPPEGFLEKLQRSLPEGFEVQGLERYHHRRPVAARVAEARYRLTLAPAPRADGTNQGDAADFAAALRRAADRYTCLEELVVERKREGKIRELDIRSYVPAISVYDADASNGSEALDLLGAAGGQVTVEYATRVTPRGAVRPGEVAGALAGLAGRDVRLVRTERLETVLS